MSLAAAFNDLFRGSEVARGQFVPAPTGAVKVSGIATTEMNPITLAHWEDHLSGKVGVGIVPARQDMKSYFGAIDIDVYGQDHAKTLAQISRLQSNLIPCLSKSGGLHVYAFFDGSINTADVREWLEHLVKMLGLDKSEVFPKQDSSDTNRPGNWINMPYFGGKDRPAITISGAAMSAEEFIALATRLRLTKAGFAAARSLSGFSAPQCLRTLIRNNSVDTGNRNNVVLAYASFLHHQNADQAESLVEQFANTWTPGLTPQEIQATSASGLNKGYLSCLNGKCTAKCYSKVQDAAPTNCLPFVTAHAQLIKYNTDPPTYFLDYPDRPRVTLTLGELASLPVLKMKLMSGWSEVRTMPRAARWDDDLHEMLQRMQVVEAPASASESGVLMDHLEAFCRSGQIPYTSNMLGASVWFHDGRHYFILDAFIKYLDQRRVQRSMKAHQISCLLHAKGAKVTSVEINGMQVDAFHVAKYQGFEMPVVEVTRAEDVL